MPARSSDRARCLLAFDTAGTACSAAVWRDGAVCARRFEAMSRGQSERLVPMIQGVMAEAGIAYPALDAIAVTCGPGGFTGVRIGLATARALALACARPVIGVSNFEAVAAAVPRNAQGDAQGDAQGNAQGRTGAGRGLAVVIDAKRRDLYVQAFDVAPGADSSAALAPATAARAIAPADLDGFLPPGPLLLAGDAVDAALAALEAAGRDVVAAVAPGQSDAAVVAALAAARPLPEAGAPPPGPIYLRGPDATLAPPPRGGPGGGPGGVP
jgi:tRNA threonylcarbamoyladenosine biosynthesis protein TsaB